MFLLGFQTILVIVVLLLSFINKEIITVHFAGYLLIFSMLEILTLLMCERLEKIYQKLGRME
jgi:hypothetical protein